MYNTYYNTIRVHLAEYNVTEEEITKYEFHKKNPGIKNAFSITW